MIEEERRVVTTSEKVDATVPVAVVLPEEEIDSKTLKTTGNSDSITGKAIAAPANEATTVPAISSRRFPTFATRRDVPHLLALCINMKAHYRWLYNLYWCATLPQLMNKLNKDGVFETLTKEGTTVSALEETSSHMEVAYELDNPMIISVLIMFHTFITSTRHVSDLIADAEKNRGAVMYNNSYDLDSGDLNNLTRFSLMSSETRSLDTWTELTDYMIGVREASNFGFSSPEEAVSKWRALSQDKDEYVEAFLSREQRAWDTLTLVCNFYSVSVPDEHERIAQLMSTVSRRYSESATSRWRKDMVSLSDLDYQTVVSALVKEETRFYTWFLWETQEQKANNASRGGKRGRGSARRNSAPCRTDESNNEQKICPHCKRPSSHEPQDCWRNPECTSVPEWFRKKYLSKQASGATNDTVTEPDLVTKESKPTPVYATVASDDYKDDVDEREPLSALGFQVLVGRPDAKASDGSQAPIVVAVDTLSVPNLVDKRLVALHPEWERVEQPGADRFVSSSGHSLSTFGLYKRFDPNDFDVGIVVLAYAADMDHLCFDARMILGSNSMQKMGANISWLTPSLDITDCGLKKATDHEIEAFCLKQLEGRELPSLSFELKPGTHPYQADRSYTVPSGLRDATNRAIDSEIAKGHWYELDENSLEPDAWVSPAFVKKKDRTEGDQPVVRVLVDLRLLNAAIQIDQHLREGQLIPNQDRFIRSIPRCTCQLNGRLIRSRTCSQGLGLSALFWGRHLDTALSYVYGGHWKRWMALFVDDFLVHAETEGRCRLRRRLVEIALKCMRKEVSDKVPSCISPTVTAIGLFFEGPFYRVSDANLEKLKSLFYHQPKNSTEVKRLIGSINWASTAFRGDTFSALGDELRILHDISTMKKFSWKDTQGPAAITRLCSMVTTLLVEPF
ncbi:hypothetical protein FOZ61_001492, partial [Perkinsus olseni]